MTIPTNRHAGDGNHPEDHNLIATLLNTIGEFWVWVKNLTTKEAMVDIYPIADKTRMKVSFWELKKGSSGNRRAFSLEVHGQDDTYHLACEPPYPLCHVTFYSLDETGDYHQKVFEWQWGENWNNRLRVFTDLQVDGALRFGGKRTIPYATSGGFQGDVCHDDNYLYVCIANNTWKRVALSSW
jgi:hypothetical protein